jgi:hypothetical protein
VAFGVTLVVLDAVVVEKLRLLPEIRTDDAFETFQERTDDEPSVMEEGDAEKELTVGGGAEEQLDQPEQNVAIAAAQWVDPAAVETVKLPVKFPAVACVLDSVPSSADPPPAFC